MKELLVLITLILFLLAGCSQKQAEIIESITTDWTTFFP